MSDDWSWSPEKLARLEALEKNFKKLSKMSHADWEQMANRVDEIAELKVGSTRQTEEEYDEKLHKIVDSYTVSYTHLTLPTILLV